MIKTEIMKRFIPIIIAAALALAAGCDKLPLQKSYSYDPVPLDPHQNMTCWEYICSSGDLTSMRKAIEMCGMQDYYSGNGEKYTFLLLDETAFATYILPGMEVGTVEEADPSELRDILMFHIIYGEYDSYNGTLSYDPIHVITLWQSLDAVMTIKLNDDDTLSNKRQDKVTFMDQCGSSTVVYATTSDLLMTNGPAHILSRNCVYVD